MKIEKQNLNEPQNPQLNIGAVVCSSCGKNIMPDDDKHCFWEEDIENGIKPECLDCHLERESIIRDFGF